MNDSKALLTIAIPCYDADLDLLRQSIQSLETQSAPLGSFRVLVVDDGSENRESVKKLCHESLLDIEVVEHTQNRGLNAARHTAVQKAQTEWILFLDADDLLTSDAVELYLNEALKGRADAVFGPLFRLEEESGNVIELPVSAKDFGSGEKRLANILSAELSFTMCGRMFRRIDLSDEIFAMPEHTLHEDCVSLPRIAARVARITVLSQPTYFYRRAEGSITTSTSLKNIKSLIFIAASWFELIDDLELRSQDLVPKARTGIENLFRTFLSRIDDRLIDEHDFSAICSSLSEVLISHGAARSGYRIQDQFGEVKKNLLNSHKRRTPHQVAYVLKDKVVILGFADYQVEGGLHIAKALRDSGLPVVVIDYSQHIAAGRRKFVHSDETRKLAARIEMMARKGSFRTTDLLMSRLVITMNDFNPLIRDAFEARRALGLPTLALIEGINDFDRVDSKPGSLRPYRRSTHRGLAGEHDQKFFSNFKNEVVGLPLIAEVADDSFAGPIKLTGQKLVLNVNFTYGVLEECGDLYTSSVISLCEELEKDLEVTRHPMDNGVVGRNFDSEKSQSELLKEDCIFVSRFGTGLLEALARGVPAIYYNPHGERVDKFANPMSAFQVAETPYELASAISTIERKIAAGFDFRNGAQDFLRHHANLDLQESNNLLQVRRRVVDLVRNILDESTPHSRHLNRRWLEMDYEENAT